MKFIKSRFVPPKLIGKTLDVSKATVTDQNILGKELAAKVGDRAFQKTISRFLPKIDIAASKRVQARQIKFGESKTQLQTKVPTNLPKRLSPVSTFTTSFGKNVKAKITKLQQQAYNLANIKQAKAYSKTTKKLGIEKSFKGSAADEIDILRSKVNTDARINVMDSEKISSANFIETAYRYEKVIPTAADYASVSYTVKGIRKGKPTSNFITRSTKVGEEQDLKFGFEKKGSKKPMIIKQSQFKKPINVPVYNFHKVNKPNINFNKQSFGQTTSGKIVLGKKLGDVSSKYNRTRNFKRSFSKFKITPKE
jgi:hypothetical protein